MHNNKMLTKHFFKSYQSLDDTLHAMYLRHESLIFFSSSLVIFVFFSSKDLILKVVHNVPMMLVYLPSQLSVSSQVSSLQRRLVCTCGVLAFPQIRARRCFQTSPP